MKNPLYVRAYNNAAGTVYSVCKGNAHYDVSSRKEANELLRKIKKTGATIETALRLEGKSW